MKAIQVSKAGGPEVLKLVKIPKPSVKEGWSLIKILGFGINRSEIFTRQGFSPNVTFPRILGIECVGIMEEASSNCSLEKGQLILSIMGEMGRAYDGSYAEYVLIPDQHIYPITSQLPLDQLVSLPESFYTAFGAMKQLKISAGDTVLVRAGASALGIAFLNLVKAKYPKIKVIASVRSITKEKQLLELGYDQIIFDQDGKLQTDLLFTKVLELIGPKTINNSISHMSKGGIICSCGQLGYQWYLEEFDPIVALSNNIYLTTFYSENVSQLQIQELLDYVDDNKVTIPKPKVFKLEEVADAHIFIEGDKGFGKAVVLV